MTTNQPIDLTILSCVLLSIGARPSLAQAFDPACLSAQESIAPYGMPYGEACWSGPQPTAPGEFAAATNLYWRNPHHDYQEPCCPVGTVNIPARWYAIVEALPLTRDAENDRPFATRGPGGPVVLSTSDLDFEFDPNMHFLLGRSLNEWYRLEISYFGTHSWNVAASARNNDVNALGLGGNLFSPFSDFGAPPTSGVDYNELATIEYLSVLNNGEINLRHRLPMPPAPYEVSLLYGARYLDVHETFHYRTESDVPAPTGTINRYDVSVDNDMIGLQLGMLSQFLVFDRTWLDWEIKGAMFHNVAEQETRYENQAGALSAFDASAEEDRTSFLGETSLILNYQITPQFACRLGYRALWLTGVALASDNFESDRNVTILGPAGLDDSGEVVYHGPSIGLLWAR